MTPDQLSAQLQGIKNQLKGFPKWADAALGVTSLAMISQRIIKKGEAAVGNFSAYSTKDSLVGASSFRTKAAATKYFGERGPNNRNSKKLEWRTVNTNKGKRNLAILPGGYKKLRELNGSKTGHKSFLWSGEMWGSLHYQDSDKKPNPAAAIKVEGTTQTGEWTYTTTVGSQNELTIKKLKGHAAREGKEILQLSKKEETALLNILDKYITNITNKAING